MRTGPGRVTPGEIYRPNSYISPGVATSPGMSLKVETGKLR